MKDRDDGNLGVLEIVFHWRRLIYRLVVIAAVASVGVSLALPKWYSAQSTFVPPSSSDKDLGFLQISSAMGIDLGGMGLLSDTPTLDLMIGILKSRRLREEMVDQFDLQTVYHSRTREHAVESLESHLTIDSTAEGLISVQVEDRDKQRAADMTNTLVGFLDRYNREMSVEKAKRTSGFISSYLEENDSRLADAAKALQDFQKEHGAIELTEQTKATVQAAAELQADRTALEIQRDVLSNYTSAGQYKMVDIQARIDEIDSKLREITLGKPGAVTGDGVLLSLADVPQLGFELAQLTRDVLVLENIHGLLAAEYEQSRIQEAKDLQSIQIVDRAVPPIRKSRPRRSLVVLLTMALIGLGGVGLAFACDGLLSKEDEWVDGGLASSSEVSLFLRIAHRIARWSGVE